MRTKRKEIRIKKLFLFLSVWLSCAYALNFNSHRRVTRLAGMTRYEEGLKSFRRGKLKLARVNFESINRGEADFVPALIELQKINYKENKWDRFFGLALYYRNLLLSAPAVAKSHFRQTPLSLEILALIRHCRFKESQQIKKWSLKMAQSINTDSSQLKKTADFFKLKNLVGDRKQRKSVKSLVKESINLWPLEKQELNRVDNPKNLRVRVKSQC